jgi:hypothetical protein
MAKVIERTKRRVHRKKNHPKFTLAESMKTMNIKELDGLETIDPRPRAPWKELPFEGVEQCCQDSIPVQSIQSIESSWRFDS